MDNEALAAADTNVIIDDVNGALRIYACEDGTTMTVLEKISRVISYAAIGQEGNGEMLEAERIKVEDAERAMLMWATDMCYVAAYSVEPDEENTAWKYLETLKRTIRTQSEQKG